MNGIYEELRIAAFAVWRRRWIALAVAWAIALVGWLVVSLIPNAYESRARVFVQTQSLLSSKVGVTAMDQQKDIDRVRQMLTSSVILDKVVRGTELGRKAQSPQDVAGAVETLRKNITLTAQADNFFEVSAKVSAGGLSDAENAKLSRAIVQKLIDLFVEENLAGDRDETGQTLSFLDAELKTREAALREAEQRRVAFEQKYLGLLPGIGSISQRMESARIELSQVGSQLMAAQGALAAVNGQMAGTPASIPVAGGGGVVGGASGRIAALEGQISDGAAKGWTDQHPDMIAARAQIARLRGSASREPRGGGGASAPNPMYVTMRSMQAEKQATVAALGARKAQLSADMASFAAKQAEEPGVAAEQARLQQDYDVKKAQYDKLLADREDVKLRSDVASKTDAVKFRVIDPPSQPRLPVAPDRPLLLFAVLVVALGGGIGAAFAIGQLRTTYPTAERLAKATGLPVLGGIGEIATPAIRALRAQRLRQFAMAAGALPGALGLLLLIEFVQRGLVA